MKKEHKRFFKRVENIYIEAVKRTGSGMPTLFYHKNGKDHVLPIPDEFRSKVQSPMDLLKPFVYELSPDVYLFCAEAWLKSFTKCKQKSVEKMERDDLGEQIRQEEIILMTGATMNGEKYRMMYDLKRKHGVLQTLEKKNAKLEKFFTRKEP